MKVVVDEKGIGVESIIEIYGNVEVELEREGKFGEEKFEMVVSEP